MASLPVTILIPARNAASTIRRAVASADAEAGCQILLLDHGSTDGTAESARQTCDRLEVLSVPPSLSIGAVRQTALEAIATKFGVWLDADDELIPGRCRSLVEHLERDAADLAFDEVQLYDGVGGGFLRHLAIPPFLHCSSDLVRCFERNYLPGVGVPGFRSEFARCLGYDPAMQGAEDYDFLLRAVAASARIALVRKPLYRQYAYPCSLSRNLDQQRRLCAHALSKHSPQQVERRLRDAGLKEFEQAWTMVAFHVFLEQYPAALQALDCFESTLSSCDAALRWRTTFQRGTLLLLLGHHQKAADWLRQAEALDPSAETCNNLGVARAFSGRKIDAACLFETALKRFPSYLDADWNRNGNEPLRVTPLPLRREPARDEYPRFPAPTEPATDPSDPRGMDHLQGHEIRD